MNIEVTLECFWKASGLIIKYAKSLSQMTVFCYISFFPHLFLFFFFCIMHMKVSNWRAGGLCDWTDTLATVRYSNLIQISSNMQYFLHFKIISVNSLRSA